MMAFSLPLRSGSGLLLALTCGLALPSQVAGQTLSGAVATDRALLDRYCVTCHNARLTTGGLSLEDADVGAVAREPEVWEKVARKLRAGAMPPAGRPRPDVATVTAFVSRLESGLDLAAAAAPDPGRTEPFHRLNRTEYATVVRDLLAFEPVSVDFLSPPDDTSYGFDNIAGVLGVSPTLMERYLAAASEISRLAVGDPSIPVTSDSYRPPSDLSQDVRLEAMPLGTRGGITIRRYYPLDAEYVVTVQFTGVRRLDDTHTVEVLIDGAPAHVVTLGGETAEETPSEVNVRLTLPAGPHELQVAFVHKSAAQSEGLLLPFQRPRRYGLGGRPYLSGVEVAGPYDPSGPGDTPSRRRIFSCRPADADAERPCASQILEGLARRGFRRPVIDADLDLLLAFYDDGYARGGFERGIQAALERLLVSPEFLFRVERDPADAAPGAPYRISDHELASRLSFFLWSSVPDDELLALAEAGRLGEPDVLDAQVRRMLADERAGALVQNFAGQWLHLRNLDAAVPDAVRFPDFDERLRLALRRETELLVDSVLREQRSVLDLLRADYTFVNERLARHYDIPNVYGSHFRRVRLTDERRRGLLGHGSILTVTSYAHRTSPVLRGKWVLENLLGTPPPPPPADVPALVETADDGAELSMREAMARHRANPACAGCHAPMDPIGFALENYDAVGRWRAATAAGELIDASGTLPGGSTFEGVAGLRRLLLDRPETFVTTVTEKLLTYALGRGVASTDAPAVRAIVREAAADDYRLRALVLAVVRSVPFQMRRAAS
jgi:mono/diheme cytochrome c family protein